MVQQVRSDSDEDSNVEGQLVKRARAHDAQSDENFNETSNTELNDNDIPVHLESEKESYHEESGMGSVACETTSEQFEKNEVEVAHATSEPYTLDQRIDTNANSNQAIDLLVDEDQRIDISKVRDELTAGNYGK